MKSLWNWGWERLSARKDATAFWGNSVASRASWLRATLAHFSKANTAIRMITAALKNGWKREAPGGRCEIAEDAEAGRAAAIIGIASKTKIGMWRTASRAAKETRIRGTITRPLGRERELASAVRNTSHSSRKGRYIDS